MSKTKLKSVDMDYNKERFFRNLYEIINYWEREKEDFTGTKLTLRDKLEGAFHSFCTLIDGSSALNDFKPYIICDENFKAIEDIDGFTMFSYFKKFREEDKRRGNE